MSKLKVGIIGGSGYTGLELMRILAGHPGAAVEKVVSRHAAGKRVAEVHRSLEGVTDLRFSEYSEELAAMDVVFAAVGHGESMGFVQALLEGDARVRVVDLGADFRLPPESFESIYGEQHTAPLLAAEAVYGLPELFAREISLARLVANPGCFASCMALSLAPLAAEGLLPAQVRVSAMTGSSGSGALAKQGTHHPERDGSVSAYNVLAHRHAPEVQHALGRLGGGRSARISMVPQSGPFSRGIYAVSFVTLGENAERAEPLYRAFAESNHFVRMRPEAPRVLDVRGSNFFDFSIHRDGDELVVIGALDNLVKGAAGNAVQNMNLMFGLAPESGLLTPPLFP